MDDLDLTPEQEEDARHILDVMMAAMQTEIVPLARMLASKENGELFGQTEFQLRDGLLKLGARGLDAALAERKKRGTKDAV